MASSSAVTGTPEEAGIDSERLEAVFARVRRDVDDGVLPSAQVAVARHGRLAGMRTFGQAVQGGEVKPATDDTLYTIFSSTKAIVAAAVWTLFEDGLLRLDERVAEIVPEFGTNGKEGITVEQVMLHVGGFPRAPLGHPAWAGKDERLKAFGAWRLNWEPGTRFEYHASSAHWVLVEIIERRTGDDFRAYLRRRLIEPMGLTNLHIGLPRGLHNRVAEVRYMQPPIAPPEGSEVTSDWILGFNQPDVQQIGVPGAGGIGTAASLALFYQPLIHGGVTDDGTRIMKAETIEWATRVRTLDFHRDPLLDVPVNRALAVVVAGDDGNMNMRGFGREASARAFGHGGAGGQIGWGDPVTGISLGYCTNGFVDPLVSGRRVSAVGSLAARCAVG